MGAGVQVIGLLLFTQVHQQEDELEAAQLGLNITPTWDAKVANNDLTCYSKMAVTKNYLMFHLLERQSNGETKKILQQARLDQAEARNRELSLSLPHGRQRSNYLSYYVLYPMARISRKESGAGT